MDTADIKLRLYVKKSPTPTSPLKGGKEEKEKEGRGEKGREGEGKGMEREGLRHGCGGMDAPG